MGNIIGWMFGILVLAIGIVNSFWGDDVGFGIFLILLSSVYFPPTSTLIDRLFKRWTGFSIHYTLKVFLGILIIWAAVGVGELPDKIELMMADF